MTVAVAAVTAAGLAVSAWRGLRTDQVVGRALQQGLGTDWRDRVHVSLRHHRPWARILLLPGLMRRHDVERIPNIRYGDAGRRNLLDIYRRRDAPHGGPVLIHFHGGSYTGGAKNREARPLLYRLAGQGWVCISANYRLRPESSFPGHQIDAKKVIAWAREHAAAYGADPSKLFVAGGSAGSNLAGLCALTPNDRAFQPGAPPILVVHGTKDALATVEGARNFAGRLRHVSDGTVVYAELPGGQHAFGPPRPPTAAPAAVRGRAAPEASPSPNPAPPPLEGHAGTRPCAREIEQRHERADST